ncbi:36554_t:CDS:2 [Racocetra persica]|uniref:36554_t:CDS:1 n=1 Tax=Racocetra persica TaxID=160502 RepID=A0ACA9LE89_9GLOM|nr:36554_t:CDS:2 [Racocetra persica]
MSGSSTRPAENAELPAQESSPAIHAADLTTIQVLTEEATKDFLLQDYESAVSKFSDASEIIGQCYGVDSEEYAEALYKYGNALLENSRTQNTVLGHQAIPQTSATDIPTDDLQANTSRFYFEGDDESDSSQPENGGNIDSQAEEASASELLEEQGDDLSLAWEILEYSRDIFSHIQTESAKRSLGEVYIKLGDISLENEKFDQAAIDYSEGAKLKTDTLPEGDRQIAEAYPLLIHIYSKIQIIYFYHENEAIVHVQKAIEVLNKRKEILQARLNDYQETSGKGKKIATDDDDTVLIDKEIKDIDEFLVEMESKIADIQAAKLSQEPTIQKPSDIALEEYVKLLSSCEPSSSSIETSSTTPVNDLTSLIKRKTTNSNATDASKNNATTETPIQEEEKKRRAEIKADTDEYGGENELNPNKKVKQ